MLTENQVIHAVKSFLEGRGYTVKRASSTTQHGDDIVAEHESGLRLYIEAKGETSDQKGSARHGVGFDNRQVLSCVSRAFYRAAVMQQATLDEQARRIGIALPDIPLFRRRVDAIQHALDKLEIAVFWVSQDGSVSVTSFWAF